MATSRAWFIKKRGSYLPNAWQGWLSYVPYVAYLLTVLAFIIQPDMNFWLGIFIFIPNGVAACVLMTWFAARHSRAK